MIKKLDDDLFSNNDVIFVNEDSSALFFNYQMGILRLDLNIINLDDVNFNDLKTIIHVRLNRLA